MAMELVYTSAERGLRPGTSGFCTVAATAGMPPALVPRLEALGGYRPGPSGRGPVALCFWRVETSSGDVHVLARVAPAPADHTGRSNKIASYLVLRPDELAEAGPAWLLSQPGLLRDAWTGEPRLIESQVQVPRGDPAPLRRAEAWQRACGDAGWAGAVASNFLRERQRPIHVVIREDMDAIALMDDVIRILPSWARWSATFSTHFLQSVAGTPCAFRFCVDGTPAAAAARGGKLLAIDLTRPLGPAPDSRYARMARTGVAEEPETSVTAAPPALSARPPAAPGSAVEQSQSPRNEPSPEEDRPEPERSAMRPVVVAVVAVALTLLLLAALVVVTRDAPDASAGEAPAAAPGDAPSEGAR